MRFVKASTRKANVVMWLYVVAAITLAIVLAISPQHPILEALSLLLVIGPVLPTLVANYFIPPWERDARRRVIKNAAAASAFGGAILAIPEDIPMAVVVSCAGYGVLSYLLAYIFGAASNIVFNRIRSFALDSHCPECGTR